MSYRDDLDAAIARAEAVDRDNAELARDNRRLAAELAEARDLLGRGSVWLGGRRAKVLLAGVAAGGVGLAIAAGLVGREYATCPVPVVVHAPSRPFAIGAMVADGPTLGHWTLSATRCVVRTDGIELTSLGDDSHAIWLSNQIADVEIPNRDFVLHDSDCPRRLGLMVEQHDGDPPTYDGHVELDCEFDGNTLQGHIEFQNCQAPSP